MEVKVNGQTIELGNSLPAITRKSIDVNNPTARFLDITNKFQVPATSENSRILESPASVGSDSRSLDKLFAVTVEDVFKYFQGNGFVEGSSRSGFSLQVQDSSADLFKALDVKLSVLSWDDKDTILTTAAIDALDTADITTCWIWNKVCLHENALKINTDQTTGDARCKYSRPSFYANGLLSRAVVAQGYTYTPSALDLAFSGWHQQFFFTSYQKTFADTFNPVGTLAITGLDTNDFAHADLTVVSGSIGIAAVKTKFRLRGSVTSDAAVVLAITATDDVTATNISESRFPLAIGTQDVDFSTAEFYSAAGMTVTLSLIGTGEVTIDALLYTLISDKDGDLSGNPFLGYKIKAFDNLPSELTYLDLFRLFCVTGNQFQVIGAYAKTFEFGNLAGLNKMNAVDWSDKFVQGSEQITSSFPGLAKKNWLKYTNDLTVNPELGWSSFATDNESLQDEGDYLVLKFGASNDVTFTAGICAHVPVYSDTTRKPEQVINIRLFAVSGSALKFGGLSWGELASSYYANWFNCLYRVRALKSEFNLSKLDVLSWSEDQLIFVDYFKTSFLVLEISNFIPGRKTNVKLLSYGR